MKTIEEKAIDYANENTGLGLSPEMAIRAYLAGATEALAGQWRKYPDEDFPESGIEYVVLTDGGDLCAVNKYAKKEDVKHYTNIVAWMPIIRPPKDESHV